MRPVEPNLPSDGPSGEQQREGGKKIVDSRAQSDDHSRGEDPCPAQRAKRLSRFREEIKPEAGQPDGQSEGMHGQDLLREECQGSEGDVAPAAANIGLYLEKWEVVLDIPQQIR